MTAPLTVDAPTTLLPSAELEHPFPTCLSLLRTVLTVHRRVRTSLAARKATVTLNCSLNGLRQGGILSGAFARVGIRRSRLCFAE